MLPREESVAMGEEMKLSERQCPHQLEEITTAVSEHNGVEMK